MTDRLTQTEVAKKIREGFAPLFAILNYMPTTFGGMTTDQMLDAGWQIKVVHAYKSGNNVVRLANGDGAEMDVPCTHSDMTLLLSCLPFVSASEDEVLDLVQAVSEARR